MPEHPLAASEGRVTVGRGTGPGQGPPRPAFEWTCAACGTKHLTRFEDGCPSCGNGTPSQADAVARAVAATRAAAPPPLSPSSVVDGLTGVTEGMYVPLAQDLVTAALEFYLAQGGLDEPTAALLRPVVEALTAPVMAEFYTPDEVAADLNVSLRVLGVLRDKGNGPPFTVVNHEVRYPKEAFDDWLANKYA